MATEVDIGFFPQDKAKIERIEKTLVTLISWLEMQLGRDSTLQLLEMLNENNVTINRSEP